MLVRRSWPSARHFIIPIILCTATGIASLLLYPDEESGDSTQPEDEDSEAGETDEQDGEAEPALHDGEPLERRTAPPSRPNLAPHSMQWAIR